MFQVEKQENFLNNKYSMFILVRIHGFYSIASDRKRDLCKNNKKRTFIDSHNLEVQIHSGLWPGLKQCHRSQGLCPSALLSSVY